MSEQAVARFFPKVLLVGYCFDGNTCDGVTTNGLFGGWPADRLAAVGGMERFPEDSVIGRYYCIGQEEERWVWPLSLLPMPGRRASGPRTKETRPDENPVAESAAPRRAPRKSATGRRAWLRAVQALDAEEFLRRLRASPRLASWAREFAPEVIYTILGSLNKIRFSKALADLTGAPLVVHIMDNWPEALHRRGLLAPYLRGKMQKEFVLILHRAQVRLTISDAMAEAYKNKYGVDFKAFHNPVDMASWGPARITRETGRPFRLLYAGRVGIANAQSIQDIAQAVLTLARAGKPVKLEIVTPDHKDPGVAALSVTGVVEVRPAIPHQGIPALLSEADALALPLDFDEASNRYARYSIPTKASEYMASGTPILVYAPPDTALAQYALKEDWAACVTTRDLPKLIQAINEISADEKLRAALSQRAQALALERHDQRKVRMNFQNLLSRGLPSSFSNSPAGDP